MDPIDKVPKLKEFAKLSIRDALSQGYRDELLFGFTGKCRFVAEQAQHLPLPKLLRDYVAEFYPILGC